MVKNNKDIVKLNQAKVDLHAHTYFSDGTLSPSELVQKAKSVGLSALAITDHDTTGGIQEAFETGEKLGIEIIPGVEISALTEKGNLHILGYYIDHKNQLLQQKLQEFIDARNERNPRILKRLSKLDLPLEMHEVESLAGGKVINRPHIARAMLNRGYVKTLQEAFDHYLADGAAAFVPKEIFTAEESISIIHEAGGLAVLAHPDQLKEHTLEATKEKIKLFAHLGIDGIEAYHGECNSEHAEYYEKVTRELGLLTTGGSDYHGDNKHNDLGEVKCREFIPYQFVEDLKRKQNQHSAVSGIS